MDESDEKSPTTNGSVLIQIAKKSDFTVEDESRDEDE